MIEAKRLTLVINFLSIQTVLLDAVMTIVAAHSFNRSLTPV